MAIIRGVLSVINSVVGFLVLLLMLSVFLGPPLYLEVSGSVAPGTVTAKEERISIRTDNWSRTLFVTMRYAVPDAEQPLESQIAVNSATYDELHVGDRAPVRYVIVPFLREFGPLPIARLAAQPALGGFVALLGDDGLRLFALLGLFLGVLIVFARWPRWWLGLPIFALMVGAGVYIGSGWPAPAPAGPRLSGSATVRDLDEVTRVWGGRRTASEEAVQPYTIVQLSYVPSGATDPVIGVDMIDAGSVRGLEQGAVVPISYSQFDPRWVQISGARRTYYWKNLRSFAVIGAFAVLLIGVPWLFRRRRSRRQQLATP